MIETKIPKDVRVYKTKILGPLTFRQMICFGIALAVDIILYQTVVKNMKMTSEAVFYMFMLVDVCILAFGYPEPMGMPLEKYLKKMFIYTFFIPQKRYPKNVIYKEKVKTVDAKKHHKRQLAIEKANPELKMYS